MDRKTDLAGCDLIVHPGHNKTATTFLQTRVFPSLRYVHYFQSPKHPLRSMVTDTLRRCSPAAWRDEQRIDRFGRQMRQLGSARAALVSGESMIGVHLPFAASTAARKLFRDPYLLASHLGEMARQTEPLGLGRVRVILGIRRQDRLLASRYITDLPHLSKPSQQDFERQVDELLDPAQRRYSDAVWLDYALTYELLAKVLGESNLLILPIELLDEDPRAYLRKLRRFLDDPGLDEWIEKAGKNTAERVNLRQVERDRWRRRHRPFGRLDLPPRRLVDYFRAWRKARLVLELHSPLSEQIMQAFASSNRRLAESIEMDLDRWGYY